MSVYTDLLHLLSVALMMLQKKKIKAERKFRATAMGTALNFKIICNNNNDLF